MNNKRAPIFLSDKELFNPVSDFAVEVVNGYVWLTHLGCYTDTVLGKGDKARVSASQSGLLQALGAAEVRLEGVGYH